MGNVNVIWKVVRDFNHETNMDRTMLNADTNLQQFHTRQMKKDFICKYQKLPKVTPSTLTEMYQDLTGDCSEPLTEAEREHRVRLVEFFIFQWG